MSSIHHSHWHTSVHLHGEKDLYCKAVLLSSNIECSVGLWVDKKSFQIKKALWEIYRGQDGPLSVNVTSLEGIEAYLGSGKALRQAVHQDYGEKALSLFSDAVRGIIQSETFLYRERGYGDTASFEEEWNKMSLNTCRFYSNLDRASGHWEKHVSDHKRFDNLFNRFKNISVATDEETYQVNAGMSDSFHEVDLNLLVDKNEGTVKNINYSLLRGPDPVCFEATVFAQGLVGQKLSSLSKKEIAPALAGSQGCVHMIDLCNDVATVLREIL